MEAETLRKSLTDLKRSTSFAPFCFVLKDGRRFEVKEARQFGMGLSTVVVLDSNELSIRFKAEEVASIVMQKTAA